MKQQLTGYHITGKENYLSIRTFGLKGSKWQKDFTQSCSDPFKLHRDGAVFCFPTLAEAEANAGEWDNGKGTIILEVIGEGVEFEHYQEGRQIAIRANTATWERVK